MQMSDELRFANYKSPNQLEIRFEGLRVSFSRNFRGFLHTSKSKWLMSAHEIRINGSKYQKKATFRGRFQRNCGAEQHLLLTGMNTDCLNAARLGLPQVKHLHKSITNRA